MPNVVWKFKAEIGFIGEAKQPPFPIIITENYPTEYRVKLE